MRFLWIPITTLVLGACLNIPPEQPPVESARKAKVLVDDSGLVVEGGNLILSIPAGAVAEGERIWVTIDTIRGAPAGYLREAYLVGPEGQTFLKPVTVTYKYLDRWVENVSDVSALFVGTASGQSWQAIAAPQHDQDSNRVQGEVSHFSVFGLIDPNAAVDGGVAILDAITSDSIALDRVSPPDAGTDVILHDTIVADTIPTDSMAIDAVQLRELSFVLVWDGQHTDLDIHLLRDEEAAFTSPNDCYYLNIGPDWVPTGSTNNPTLDVDDLDGYGPEMITLHEASSGTYVAAVHVYDFKSDVPPVTATLRVYYLGSLINTQTRQMQRCGDLYKMLEIQVHAQGQMSFVPRTDAPIDYVSQSTATCR